jgi:hypothetical protein
MATDLRDTGWQYPDLFSSGALIILLGIVAGPLIIGVIIVTITKVVVWLTRNQ